MWTKNPIWTIFTLKIQLPPNCPTVTKFLTHSHSSKVKIQRFAPTFTVVPFCNNVQHNIVPTSFHVIDAVIVFVIQFSNLPVTHTHAHNYLTRRMNKRTNEKKIHTKLTTTTTFTLNIYYDFHAMCSLIYLACVWILTCSTEPTLIPTRNACIHTPAHPLHVRNPKSNDFSSCSLRRHRQRFPRSAYSCCCCGGIRYCPCTFHHFTSPSMPQHR